MIHLTWANQMTHCVWIIMFESNQWIGWSDEAQHKVDFLLPHSYHVVILPQSMYKLSCFHIFVKSCQASLISFRVLQFKPRSLSFPTLFHFAYIFAWRVKLSVYWHGISVPGVWFSLPVLWTCISITIMSCGVLIKNQPTSCHLSLPIVLRWCRVVQPMTVQTGALEMTWHRASQLIHCRIKPIDCFNLCHVWQKSTLHPSIMFFLH